MPPLRNSPALLQGPVPDRPAGGQRLPLRKCDGELSHLSVGADDLGGPRAHAVRPYSGKRPRTLVRKRQAQKRNRSNFNFLPAQAPSGAGRDRPQALLILRAGNVLLTSRAVSYTHLDVYKRQR